MLRFLEECELLTVFFQMQRFVPFCRVSPFSRKTLFSQFEVFDVIEMINVTLSGRAQKQTKFTAIPVRLNISLEMGRTKMMLSIFQ